MAAKEIGKIEAVCVSRTKGTAKQNIGQAILKEDYGMQGDAHAGSGTVLLEITQIGKECHSGCTIARRTGTCIMPTNGVFARVLTEGTIRTGDCFEVVSNK